MAMTSFHTHKYRCLGVNRKCLSARAPMQQRIPVPDLLYYKYIRLVSCCLADTCLLLFSIVSVPAVQIDSVMIDVSVVCGVRYDCGLWLMTYCYTLYTAKRGV